MLMELIFKTIKWFRAKKKTTKNKKTNQYYDLIWIFYYKCFAESAFLTYSVNILQQTHI